MYGDNSSSFWIKRRLNPLQLSGFSSKPKEFDFSKVNLISSDSIFQETKPFMATSKCLGLYPISINMKTGHYSFCGCSPSALYFYLSFIVLTIIVAQHISLNFYYTSDSHVTKESRFDDAVINYFFYLYYMLYLLPLIAFYESKEVANYKNEWSLMQAKYSHFTGKPFRPKLKKKVYSFLIVLSIVWTISLTVSTYQMHRVFFEQRQDMTFWNILSIAISFSWFVLLTGVSLFNWYLYMESINQMSRSIIVMIQDVGAGKSNQTLSQCEKLWFDLNKLIKSTGNTFSTTIIYLILFDFLILTTSCYVTIAQLNKEVYDVTIYAPAFSTVTSLCALLAISVKAHNSVKVAGEVVQDTLLHLKWEELTEENKRALDGFLATVSFDPPTLNLGGYVEVKKSLNTSLLGTVVTYLIVLLQFRSSSPDESSN